MLVEVSERGLAMRENLVVRDSDGAIRAWGSVHDRAPGRMLFVHVVARDLDSRGGTTIAPPGREPQRMRRPQTVRCEGV